MQNDYRLGPENPIAITGEQKSKLAEAYANGAKIGQGVVNPELVIPEVAPISSAPVEPVVEGPTNADIIASEIAKEEITPTSNVVNPEPIIPEAEEVQPTIGETKEELDDKQSIDNAIIDLIVDLDRFNFDFDELDKKYEALKAKLAVYRNKASKLVEEAKQLDSATDLVAEPTIETPINPFAPSGEINPNIFDDPNGGVQLN